MDILPLQNKSAENTDAFGGLEKSDVIHCYNVVNGTLGLELNRITKERITARIHLLPIINWRKKRSGRGVCPAPIEADL